MNTLAVYVQTHDSVPLGAAVHVDCLLRGRAAKRDLQLSGVGQLLRSEPLQDGSYGLVIRATTKFKISRLKVEVRPNLTGLQVAGSVV